MWPFGMTRQEMKDFLTEYSYELIEILLDAYDMTVDEIVMNHMAEDAVSYVGDVNYWEVC